MHQQTARVLWNKQIGSSYYIIGLSCSQRYAYSIPGQFVMLRVANHAAPLLRRPFSIHRLIREGEAVTGIELLYKIVGEGTLKLSLLREGDQLDVLGPLGNGFSLSDDHASIFIVAGGIGVAPLVFLADVLKQDGFDFSRVHVFIGGRSKEDVLCSDIFSDLGLSVCTTTDDGSEGNQCLVTSPLEEQAAALKPDMIYACGPTGMLECVVGIAESHSIPCEISIETAMACGIGVCLGCAVESSHASGKYLHACVDGPVFNTRRIRF
jgi:dihydroorotate dehydrogenase electron transfer subunit